MPTTLRTTRVAAAALAVPLVIAGTSCAEDASAETVTSVLDAGAAEDVVTLPPAPEVGQRAAGTLGLDMKIDVSAGAQDLSIDTRFSADMSAEVVEVAEDGGYVLRSTLSNLQVDGSPSEFVSELEQVFPDEVTYDERYNADGEIESTEVVDTGLTDDELESAEEFVSQAETGSLYPPGVPVGVGATWTATTALESSGADVEMAVLSELSSLTESEYVVDMSIDSDIDTEIEGETLTGSVTGGGQLVGDRANPLVLTGTMTVDMELSGAGMSMTLDMAVDYDFAEPAS